MNVLHGKHRTPKHRKVACAAFQWAVRISREVRINVDYISFKCPILLLDGGIAMAQKNIQAVWPLLLQLHQPTSKPLVSSCSYNTSTSRSSRSEQSGWTYYVLPRSYAVRARKKRCEWMQLSWGGKEKLPEYALSVNKSMDSSNYYGSPSPIFFLFIFLWTKGGSNLLRGNNVSCLQK